jgi:hypothetical protein
MRAWYREPALALAALGLTGASALAAWTTWRAFAGGPRDRAVAPSASVATAVVVESDPVPAALIARTVDRDAFHPERRRPTIPFRLPSETAAAAARSAASAPPPPPPLRLVGTVITPGGDAFAMSQLGEETPRVVRVGGTLGGFTLRRIEPGRAVFTAPNGETTDLRVPKAGP